MSFQPTDPSSTFKTLDVRVDGGVLRVQLARPEVRNAFNATLIGELTRVFSVDALRPEIRIITLRGKGEVFCAGGDLAWMRGGIKLPPAENLADTVALTEMFRVMNECPKPVIAAIQGAAIGGGVGMIAVCDHVIATEDTQLSLSEVRLGIVPACIGPFVIAKIGASHARSLFITAERFRAPKAREVGLVHQLVKDAAELERELDRVVGNMPQCGPEALKHAKALVLELSWPERRAARKDPYHYVAKMLADLRVSPEGQEGTTAFLEKRKPNWAGK